MAKVFEETAHDATGTYTPIVSQVVATEQTTAIAGLRDRSRILHEDAQDLHHRALRNNLSVRAQGKAHVSTKRLLQELSERGFAWSQIARLLKISVPGLRKWRQGESPTGPNRARLAELVALCELLEQEYHNDDVAGWMFVPLDPDAPITPADLYRQRHIDRLIDWASHRASAAEILDSLDPSWRQRYESDIEVFTAQDGMRAFRRKR
jgi:hypothetical protein